MRTMHFAPAFSLCSMISEMFSSEVSTTGSFPFCKRLINTSDLVTSLVDTPASIVSPVDLPYGEDIDKESEQPQNIPASTQRQTDRVLRSSRATKSSSNPTNNTVTTVLRQLVLQTKIVLDESDTDGEVSSTTGSEGASDGDRAERNLDARCLRPLTNYVNLLMDLCPTLEQTYTDMHDGSSRYPQRLLHDTISVTPAAVPYVGNVQDKFPRASQELVRRLGEANWQRHERLRAIQIHGPTSEPITVKDAKSLFRPVSQFQDSALGSSIRTQSQRAESTASHSSFVSSSADQEKGHFRVPPLPRGASYGETFACPYCGMTVSKVKNRVDWK